MRKAAAARRKGSVCHRCCRCKDTKVRPPWWRERILFSLEGRGPASNATNGLRCWGKGRWMECRKSRYRSEAPLYCEGRLTAERRSFTRNFFSRTRTESFFSSNAREDIAHIMRDQDKKRLQGNWRCLDFFRLRADNFITRVIRAHDRIRAEYNAAWGSFKSRIFQTTSRS